MFNYTKDQEKKLNFVFDRNHIEVKFLDENLNLLHHTVSACYSGMGYRNPQQIKFIDVLFDDYLTLELATIDKTIMDKQLAKLWMETLEELGQFRSVSEWNVTYENPKKPKITIRFDANKTSMVEIFYVSNLIRTIDHFPAIVYDFFKLQELKPDKPTWELLCISFGISLGTYRTRKNNNHVWIETGYLLYVQPNPLKFFEIIDKAKVPCYNTNYSRTPEQIRGYKEHGVLQSLYIKTRAGGWQEDDKLSSARMEKFSDDIYNSFLNKEGVEKLLNEDISVTLKKTNLGDW